MYILIPFFFLFFSARRTLKRALCRLESRALFSGVYPVVSARVVSLAGRQPGRQTEQRTLGRVPRALTASEPRFPFLFLGLRRQSFLMLLLHSHRLPGMRANMNARCEIQERRLPDYSLSLPAFY